MGQRAHHPPRVITVRVTLPLLLLSLLAPAPALAGAPTGLDRIVGHTVRSAYPALHRCFRKALAGDRSRSGTVFIRATLGREDRVRAAKAVHDELKHLPTARCLVALVVKWRLPGAAEAGAGPDSEVVIPLTLRPDMDQYTVSLQDADPCGEGPARTRPLLTAKSVGAARAAVTHLTLDGRWEAVAPAKTDLALVILDGAAGKGLGPGAAIWVPSGGRFVLQGKATALIVASRASGAKDLAPRVVKPGKARKQAGGKLKVTPLLGRPGAGTGKTYVGLLEAVKGFKVKAHHHGDSDELVFVIKGSARTTLRDRQEMVSAGSAVNIPALVGHSLDILEAMKVVQVYAPGGPEERFFKAAPRTTRSKKRKRAKKGK